MKKIITLLTILLTLSLKAQYDLNSHPLYSDVWRIETIEHFGQKTNNILPKDTTKSFSLKYEHIRSSIDLVKVESYLAQSYEEFRNDYGLYTPVEDKKMSKQCEDYSKTLINKTLKHSDFKNKYSECLGKINYITLTHLDTNNVDINKVIADCFFDLFVGCPAHMAILLNENISSVGFGFSEEGIGLVVCFRSKR